MAITLLEVMERVGSKETNRVKAYLREAMTEIQTLIPETTTGSFVSVVADQRAYTLPAAMINLIGVYRKYDTDTDTSLTKYIRIGEIHDLNLIQHDTSTAVSGPDDVIVI